MKRNQFFLAYFVIAVALLVAAFSLGFSHSADAQGTCWSNGVSHTCSAAETTALTNAGSTYLGKNFVNMAPEKQIGQTITVGMLPTCTNLREGARANISDATAPAWHTALTGGGSVHVGGVCRGGSWVAE